MSYRVILAPEARAELSALRRYIARESSPVIAARYVGAILDRCGRLSDFPHRGSPRDDIRKGVRTIVFRKRVTIAYIVSEDQVTILRFFHAGQSLGERP